MCSVKGDDWGLWRTCLIHLVVPGNVLVKRPQHDHRHHARQEEHDNKGVHDAV